MATFELRHAARTDPDSTAVQLDAVHPWDAVTQLRESIPDDHIVLSVRRLDDES